MRRGLPRPARAAAPAASTAGSNRNPPADSYSERRTAGSSIGLVRELRLGVGDRPSRSLGAVRPGRDVERERPLRRPALGRARGVALERLDPLARELGEPAQVGPDVAVVGVEPVLVERVGRRPGRVEPDRVADLALAELRARRRQQQLVGETVGRLGVVVQAGWSAG